MKKLLQAIGVFILVFLIYHIGFGCNVFPVDEATNTLLAPDWYSIVGIALSAGVAVLFSKRKKRSGPIDFQTRVENEECKIVIKSQPAEAASTNEALKRGVPVKDRNPLEVIQYMENQFESQYQYAFSHLLNLHESMKLYEETVKKFDCIELPLMAQIRFEQLQAEYKEKFSNPNPLIVVDQMDGPAFEAWCAELLRKNGFTDVAITPTSRDQGVDIIAVKDGIRYAIQCKRYATDLGNTPIQEVNAGKQLYHCQVGAVMTNRHFTTGAKKLAEATGTLLWDRDKLSEMLKQK